MSNDSPTVALDALENVAIGSIERVPYLEQYFGWWAMHEDHFRAGVEQARTIDLHVHLASRGADVAIAAKQMQAAVVVNGVAIIPVSGTMMKQESSMTRSTSTVLVRRQIRQAMRDDEVRGVLLLCDSPGGTVSGTQDLAADVAAAAKQKPVIALIEDLGASACYWVASQAREIFAANETTMIGSIGTYGVIHDLSGLAAKEGVKVHVVRAGAHKGTGVPGTEVTADQLADYQRVINSLNEQFLQGVATGRRLQLDRVRELADGRVHVGSEAVRLKLADGVASLDEVLARFDSPPSSRSRSKNQMSNSNTAPAAGDVVLATAATLGEQTASLEQLMETLFPGQAIENLADADNRFLMSQLAKKATTDNALKALVAHQRAQIEAANKAAADADRELSQLRQDEKPGVATLGSGAAKGASTAAAAGGDPVAIFNERVDAAVARGLTPMKARQEVLANDPALRVAYVAAHNAAHGRKKQARAFAEDHAED